MPDDIELCLTADDCDPGMTILGDGESTLSFTYVDVLRGLIWDVSR